MEMSHKLCNALPISLGD